MKKTRTRQRKTRLDKELDTDEKIIVNLQAHWQKLPRESTRHVAWDLLRKWKRGDPLSIHQWYTIRSLEKACQAELEARRKVNRTKTQKARERKAKRESEKQEHKMDSEKTFKVTLNWILDHKTAAGGWTKAQFEALGLTWSQKKKGWMQKVCGHKITDEQRQAFEDGRTIVAETTRKRMLKADLAIINKLPNTMK